MKELRRKERAIPDEDAMAMLNEAEYGVLSTVDEKGKPYGVPLNFCVIDHCVYFHCAVEGHKIDNIRNNASVSFCVVGNAEIAPEKFSTKYASVIVFGEAEEVFAAEKQTGLEGLLRKYSAEFFDSGLKYIEGLREKTSVFRIRIEKLTGKAN
ncbi:MAG TPA: pyridoxamine 5'-phosphate oxidase family protein [Desulfobacterales bacterium]|nr:pyridoxamine 5'-phosphate oxidase family protein [Desulfobacterales bacterium]HIP40680.1 pyridoxamine 5'-phosphate oxidase family protein [Desulfocapsa sulfexigens]